MQRTDDSSRDKTRCGLCSRGDLVKVENYGLWEASRGGAKQKLLKCEKKQKSDEELECAMLCSQRATDGM